MDGLITYLRTSSEVKNILGLGFKKVISLLKNKKIHVRLQPFMQQILLEKKKDKKYLEQLNRRLMEWQDERDSNNSPSAVLVYHHSGARALHGFRYKLINYIKKDREQYRGERKSFSAKERVNWLKKIAVCHQEQLSQAGFNDQQIEQMKIKGRAPARYEVHHRIPLDDGGTNEGSNLILIRNDVEHRSIHGYYNPAELRIKLLELGEETTVALPVPPEDAVVYPNESCDYNSEKIPNSKLVELYDVD